MPFPDLQDLGFYGIPESVNIPENLGGDDYVSNLLLGNLSTTVDTSDAPLTSLNPMGVEGTPPGSSGGVETADQTYRTSPESGDTSFGRYIKDLLGAGGAKSLLGKGLDLASSKAGFAGLLALLSMLDRQRRTGGGTGLAYQGPAPLTRTVTQGRYGPIARYAAEGGIMQAYANGGAVRPFQMEDGGFVMTKKAVDGAGGPEGLKRLLPETRMIGGPADPTGRKDLTPAVIKGPNGNTPAKVSYGEGYVPPGRDTKGLYALMRSLENRA